MSIAKVLPFVDYRQGMHFIADAIYSQTEQNAEQTFFIFLSLILRKNLIPLFGSESKEEHFEYNLRQFQLLSLLKEHVPEIMRHFRIHEVDLSILTTSFLFTLFQGQQLSSKLMLAALDCFFFDDWIAAFSIILGILSN